MVIVWQVPFSELSSGLTNPGHELNGNGKPAIQLR